MWWVGPTSVDPETVSDPAGPDGPSQGTLCQRDRGGLCVCVPVCVPEARKDGRESVCGPHSDGLGLHPRGPRRGGGSVTEVQGWGELLVKGRGEREM